MGRHPYRFLKSTGRDMLTSYIRAAMRKAHYEILPDDGSF